MEGIEREETSAERARREERERRFPGLAYPASLDHIEMEQDPLPVPIGDVFRQLAVDPHALDEDAELTNPLTPYEVSPRIRTLTHAHRELGEILKRSRDKTTVRIQDLVRLLENVPRPRDKQAEDLLDEFKEFPNDENHVDYVLWRAIIIGFGSEVQETLQSIRNLRKYRTKIREERQKVVHEIGERLREDGHTRQIPLGHVSREPSISGILREVGVRNTQLPLQLNYVYTLRAHAMDHHDNGTDLFEAFLRNGQRNVAQLLWEEKAAGGALWNLRWGYIDEQIKDHVPLAEVDAVHQIRSEMTKFLSNDRRSRFSLLAAGYQNGLLLELSERSLDEQEKALLGRLWGEINIVVEASVVILNQIKPELEKRGEVGAVLAGDSYANMADRIDPSDQAYNAHALKLRTLGHLESIWLGTRQAFLLLEIDSPRRTDRSDRQRWIIRLGQYYDAALAYHQKQAAKVIEVIREEMTQHVPAPPWLRRAASQEEKVLLTTLHAAQTAGLLPTAMQYRMEQYSMHARMIGFLLLLKRPAEQYVEYMNDRMRNVTRIKIRLTHQIYNQMVARHHRQFETSEANVIAHLSEFHEASIQQVQDLIDQKDFATAGHVVGLIGELPPDIRTALLSEIGVLERTDLTVGTAMYYLELLREVFDPKLFDNSPDPDIEEVTVCYEDGDEETISTRQAFAKVATWLDFQRGRQVVNRVMHELRRADPLLP